MKTIFREIKGYCKQLTSGGFFHIIFSSTLVKVVAFISAIFLPRIIADRADYGLLGYVDNIRSYILLINGLGISNAILRFCSKDEAEEKKWGYLKTEIKIGLIFDVIIVAVSIVLMLVLPEKFDGERSCLLISSIIPIFFFLFESIQLFLRACFRNKEYSYLSLIFSVLMVIFQILGGIVGNVAGVLISRYVALIISIFIGVLILKKAYNPAMTIEIPNSKETVSIIKFGVIMMLATVTSSVMSLNETQFLAAFSLDETVIADYKIASYMFFISTFLSMAIATFLNPYFAKHREDKHWVWKNYKKIMIVNIPAMAVLHVVLWFLCGFITKILFGEQYLGAVPFMKLLLIASFGQTAFRMLTGNIMAMIGCERTNLIINIISIAVHWAICRIFISMYGIYGVVAGPIAVYYLSSIPMIIALRRKCKSSI